ncbi:MAG: sugar phosphate isomerase/epimerase [Bacillota bacterium]|nr:sugar phosphate isomerase/epimerase [Bacillota bacterium]
MIHFGVSTACLYPTYTEDALFELISKGVRRFEIFFNTISEIQPEFLKMLRKMCDDNNCRIKSIHPFTSGYEPYLIFTDYERRVQDTLDFYKRYYETAQFLGADILILHGDRKTAEIGISDEEYFENFLRLSEIGDKYGVTLAQENVNLFRAQHPDFIIKMKSYLKERAKFVLDIKQSVRSGNDPYKVCEAMGSGLVHIHINDNTITHDCLLPKQGSMDFQRLFDQLERQNYNGDMILEVYKYNYNAVDELIDSYKAIQLEYEKHLSGRTN